MLLDDPAEMAIERRRKNLKQQKKQQRFQELKNLETKRKQHIFYPIAKRVQHINKKDIRRLLKANDDDFNYSLAELLSSPDYIFPEVPVDDLTVTGLTSEELEMYERVARQLGLPKVPKESPNMASPGQPRISPFPQYESEISHEIYPDFETMKFEDTRLNLMARSFFNF